MLAKKDFRQVFTGLITVAVVVFYILIFVGCNSTSPGLPGLYVVKLANNQTNASVHIGLFSLCAGIENSTVANSNLTCAGTFSSVVSNGNSTNGSVSTTTKYYLPGTTSVAAAALQPLLALADGIQSGSTGPGGVLSIIYIPLLLSALCFASAGGSLIAFRVFSRAAAAKSYDDGADEKVFRHERNSWNAAIMMTTGAVMAAVAAAIATTVAVRALLFAGTDLPGSDTSSKSTTAIDVSGGTSVQVLEWLIVAFVMLWHPILEPFWRKLY
ncbi:hypothetical protein F503_02508 [Ophiostoma piceae UAMH 11346]|uniref:Uncharacterized protein n=1 Tax=Ophiostoma piceae (strain UAMH 11346) TaxID=1262450 RepID=S3CZI8_OPHP1|nr:hypothetical protein F503_02508 [Ophiostoma piceae UAMH 11346]